MITNEQYKILSEISMKNNPNLIFIQSMLGLMNRAIRDDPSSSLDEILDEGHRIISSQLWIEPEKRHEIHMCWQEDITEVMKARRN